MLRQERMRVKERTEDARVCGLRRQRALLAQFVQEANHDLHTPTQTRKAHAQSMQAALTHVEAPIRARASNPDFVPPFDSSERACIERRRLPGVRVLSGRSRLARRRRRYRRSSRAAVRSARPRCRRLCRRPGGGPACARAAA
eukprot:877049-Pleurochrysis_carterae.AAC.5